MINLRDKYNQTFSNMPNGHTGKVVYSESRRNAMLEDYINDNLELIQEAFTESGLEFTYLPHWLDYEDDDYAMVGSPHVVLEEKNDYIPTSEYKVLESPRPIEEFRVQGDVRFREVDSLDKKYEQLRKQIPDWVLSQLFDGILQQNEQLSRMVVGPQNKLILMDYDNIEIELRPIEMAFYLLFLRHQEGINFKDLVDHKDELWRYYKHATVTDDLDKMKLGLERLIDPLSGSANEHRSRISRAINEATHGKFTPELARFYKIEGAKGEDKKIPLPQDKIVFNLDW